MLRRYFGVTLAAALRRLYSLLEVYLATIQVGEI
jgi:hypothetical protein